MGCDAELIFFLGSCTRKAKQSVYVEHVNKLELVLKCQKKREKKEAEKLKPAK